MAMFLKPPKSSTDPRLRSLLQKAARRGFIEVVDRALVLLEQRGDKTWLRSRAIVITFEECWLLASSLSIKPELASKRNAIVKVTRSIKQKDAAGLGALAYAYREGDRSMLDCVPDEQLLRYIGGALDRPSQFFNWLHGRSGTEESRHVIGAAEQYLAAATWQWDKACILAGALLSTCGTFAILEDPVKPQGDFPYWIAIDKHTPQGKTALKEVARRLSLSHRQLIWASFYFESARVNSLTSSPWWEAEKSWRLRRAGLTVDSAEKLWLRARDTVRECVLAEAESLQKMMEGVNRIPRDDGELFGA
jgi:hypothetical protein